MLNIAICDDEIHELTNISSLFTEYNNKSLYSFKFSSFSNGASLLNAIDSGTSFDIVLLDICMSCQNGIEIAKEIRATNKVTEIMFLTSSPEYAVESYSVKARNYILKPIDRNNLFPALDEIFMQMKIAQEKNIIIKDIDSSSVKIYLTKLMYCEVIKKSVYLYLSDGSFIETRLTFSETIKLISGNPEFIQTHRSYLVNLNYVQRITKNELILINGRVLPISRNKQMKISQKFMQVSFNEAFM